MRREAPVRLEAEPEAVLAAELEAVSAVAAISAVAAAMAADTGKFPDFSQEARLLRQTGLCVCAEDRETRLSPLPRLPAGHIILGQRGQAVGDALGSGRMSLGSGRGGHQRQPVRGRQQPGQRP